MFKTISFYNNIFKIYLFIIFIFNIGCFALLLYKNIFINLNNQSNKIKKYINNFDKLNKIINDINLFKNQFNINKNYSKNYSKKLNSHKKNLKILLSTNKKSEIYNKYKITINNIKNKGINTKQLNKMLLHLLTINCDI